MYDSMISLACCESPVETGSAAGSLGSGEGGWLSSPSPFRFEGVCGEADNDAVAGENELDRKISHRRTSDLPIGVGTKLK